MHVFVLLSKLFFGLCGDSTRLFPVRLTLLLNVLLLGVCLLLSDMFMHLHHALIAVQALMSFVILLKL